MHNLPNYKIWKMNYLTTQGFKEVNQSPTNCKKLTKVDFPT